jgi:hypothetical protein
MENKNCEICESLATNLCFKCLAYYCDSCYNLIHKKKENGDQHKKDNLNSNIIHIEIKCPEHQKYPKELFCIDEKSNFIFIYF